MKLIRPHVWFPICIIPSVFSLRVTSSPLTALWELYFERWPDVVICWMLVFTWVSRCALRGTRTRSTVKWSSSTERARTGAAALHYYDFFPVRLFWTHSFFFWDWIKMKDFGKVSSSSGSAPVALPSSGKCSGTSVRLIGHAGCVGA